MVFGPPPQSTPPKRRSSVFSCAGCGCALLLVILLLLGTIAYSAYHLALRMTSATPTPVPQADGGPEVYAAQKKIAAFRQAIEYGQPATLQLDSDEINTYIARDPSMAAVRGHLFVHLQDGDATLQSDLQLGNFEKFFLPERYIDGTADLSFVFHPEDSSFVIDLHGFSLKGRPLPAAALANVNQSLNNAIDKQTQARGPIRDFLDHTQKIAIENGELVIVTR